MAGSGNSKRNQSVLPGQFLIYILMIRPDVQGTMSSLLMIEAGYAITSSGTRIFMTNSMHQPGLIVNMNSRAGLKGCFGLQMHLDFDGDRH